MALQWEPVDRDYFHFDSGRPRGHVVIGLLAHIPGERWYEIWPADPMGTTKGGWTLALSDGQFSDDQGMFSTAERAKAFAEQHFARDG